jgi:hypothetical protein
VFTRYLVKYLLRKYLMSYQVHATTYLYLDQYQTEV